MIQQESAFSPFTPHLEARKRQLRDTANAFFEHADSI
jgi:hypothetical protein